MPKNLGLYNNDLSVPRKQDIDAVASRVSTNEDNIAMLDSDMEAAQGDITTLKSNVTTLTNALNSKQDTIAGGASTITEDNLTANRALVSNSSGKVDVSGVTSTELSYLSGATSKVQDQIDGKVNKSGDTMTGTLTVGSASLQTNGYVTGTWLKSTADNHSSSVATKVAIFDGSGWLYNRTVDELKSDMGLSDGGGGTTIVLSSSQPSGLKAGDYWYQIVT